MNMSISEESLLARVRKAEQIAEAALQRAQQERHRADAADLQAQQERQRADTANLQVQQERHRADAADLRAQQEQQRTRKTTLEEFIRFCHDHFQNALSVEPDIRLTTKGFTSTKNKYYPKFLRPWADFPDIQRQSFNSIRHFFHADDQHPRRFFNSIQHIEELAHSLGSRKLASEKDLETYERTAVENMVATIFDALSEMPGAQAELGFVGKTAFHNHGNSLSDMAEEVQQCLHPQTPRTRHSRSSSSSSELSLTSQLPLEQPRSRADQFCVTARIDETQKLLCLIEYKPPHKLSIGNLKAGLRDMDLKKKRFSTGSRY